jgi:hypothetical protein
MTVTVEVYRGFMDNTWDTVFIDYPNIYDTDEATRYALTVVNQSYNGKIPIAFTGVYNIEYNE